MRVKKSNGAMPNSELLEIMRAGKGFDMTAMEVIKAMYAHVGESTVLTIRFIGRIEEASDSHGLPSVAMSSKEIKKIICGTAAAKDPAVRQALIDLLGHPGIKADPGPTYGVSKHAWRALAAAMAATELYWKDSKITS
jgi:hypothetical protein